MRYYELFEAPITDWNVDPDFDQREDEMLSNRSGYRSDVVHYDKSDKQAMRNPVVIERAKSAFLKVPYDFNFFFGHATDPNYDRILSKGKVDLEWIEEQLGPKAKAVISETSNSGNITIVFTNNLSDDNKINLRSTWAYAHRMSHSLIYSAKQNSKSWEAIQAVRDFIRSIAVNAYGVKWPRPTGQYNWDQMREMEYWETYVKVLARHLATMNSARQGKIINAYEFIHELFSQWLITGKITMNELPSQIHEDEVLTSDSVKLARAQKALTNFPRIMDRKFHSILDEAKGGIWVI